jgi:ABC-type branched-subunit amino acid transport system substrate-binding protein
MRPKIKVLVVIAAVIALVTLVVVGCGGTTTTTAAGGGTTTTGAATTTTAGGGGTTTTAGGPTTTAGTSGADIPFGFLTSYTGELGAYGTPWYDAGKMAVDDINAAGGVLGRKITLYTEDDASAVEKGIQAARKLISVNKVVVIAGPISDVVVGIYPVCKDNKVFVTSEAAGTTKLDTGYGEWFFRTVPSDSFDGKVAAKTMIDNGIKTISVMYENDESRISISNALKTEFKAEGGTIISDVAFQPKQPTYSAELKKVSAGNPQMVWLGSGQESGSVLLKNAKQAGYKWKWMVSSDLAVPDMFKLVGNDVMQGILSETPSADTSQAYVQDWNARYKATFNLDPTGLFQANSYDQVIIMALAMQMAGTADGTAVSQFYHKVTDVNPNATVVHSYADGLAALKAGKEIKYEGVSGPCVFNDQGNTVGSYTSLIANNGNWDNLTFYPASTFVAK